jgi:hypothetical protein
MTPPKVCVFPDTNIFLHYRALNEIDWCALLCVQELEIEIAPIVTRELEEQKTLHSSQKLRERADRSLRLLHQHLSNPRLRHGVTVRFLAKEPTDDIARSRGLNLRLGDDWLIGTLLLYREEISDSRCVIAAGDLPMTVKARHYEIEIITPDERFRLPSEQDPLEKKNKQLEAELLRYQKREPLLDMHFVGGSKHHNFYLSRPTATFDPEPEIQSKLAAAVGKCQPVELKPKQVKSLTKTVDSPLVQSAGFIAEALEGFAEFGRNFYEDYNVRVAEYRVAYEKYLRDTVAFATLPARTILIVENRGTCPAEDIHVLLHFPDGFTLHGDKDPPEKPREPVVPSKEINLGVSMFRTPEFPDYRNLQHFYDPTQPTIRKTKSYEVTFESEELQHGLIWNLDPLYIVFDSFESATSFSFGYSIHAGNMIDEETGMLAVVIG